MHHMDAHVGTRIVAARRRKGMSQRTLANEIAKRTGKNPESVRRSLINNEPGHNAPRVATVELIAEITGQPMDFFRVVGGDDAPFRPAVGEAA